MTEHEHRRMTRRDWTTSEALDGPNTMMHADLMEHLRDVTHHLQSTITAMDRNTREMARVARRLGDLECAMDR